jgi:transketolase
MGLGAAVSDRSMAIAREARRLVVESAIKAQAAHVGSALSIVDVLAVLYGEILPDPDGAPEARLLLSKGHGAAALYATLAAVGVLTAEEVTYGYCADGGRLHGHPERGVPGVEMTGGSLGHGPAIAVGIALAERDGPRRTYCLVGDGELGEGSVWEALALAGHLKLDRLNLVVDANGLQGLGRCEEVLGLDPLAPKLQSFGFDVTEADGHDHGALEAAFRAPRGERPRAVIARTVKGHGISWMEGELMSHYRPIASSQRDDALAELERC